eukprot:g39189.t1
MTWGIQRLVLKQDKRYELRPVSKCHYVRCGTPAVFSFFWRNGGPYFNAAVIDTDGKEVGLRHISRGLLIPLHKVQVQG